MKTSITLFVCNRGDTLQYHGSLRLRDLDQAVMLLVFPTPRQGSSSQPPQQMVWLYRDSMPNRYTINHPTTLHTHKETQWPNAAHGWHFALQDVSHRQNCHVLTPSHPQCDHAVFKLSVDAGSLCSECKTISYCRCFYFF